MIDIGVNLTNSRFTPDIDAVLERAADAGLSQILVTGTSIKESEAAITLCHQYPEMLSCTAGVHPHDAANVDSDFIAQLSMLADLHVVKAIGECGLDFNRNFSPQAVQIDVFDKQIHLAVEKNMPLFLHQRDAFDPWEALLLPAIDKVPAMVSHCFTGDKAQLKRCLDLGMYIGITGWVCDERRGAELQEAVKYIPLDRLLVETDAPYLTPRTIRPKPKSSRNEPSYLPFVTQKIAELMGCTHEEIIACSIENAKRVFKL